MSAPEPQSDVSRPSALPTARLTARPQRAGTEQSAEDFLNQREEEVNKKVDAEIEVLVDGMVDLVALAAVGDKDKFKIAQEGFQAESRAESMIRATNSLFSITHSLKLLLLLSDEGQIAQRRDAQLKMFQEEKDQARQDVTALLDELLNTRKAPTASSTSLGHSPS